MEEKVYSEPLPTPEAYGSGRQSRASGYTFEISSTTLSSILTSLQSNSSPPPPLLTNSWEWTIAETFLSLILGLIVIGTIIGNFLVLFAFITRRRDLKLPTHYFVANLALADFLVGVLVLPYLATLQVTHRWYFGQGFCLFWTVTHFWLCSSSILSTVAVCIERYVGVKYPLKHKDIMKPINVSGMIVVVWILAGILSLSSIFVWPQPPSEDPYVCTINQQIGHVIMATVGILYIPAAIMIVLYWRIFVIATKHFNALGKNKKAGVGLYSRTGAISSEATSSSGDGGSSSFSSGDGDVEGAKVSVGVGDGALSSSSTSNNNGQVPHSIDTVKAASTKKQINLAKRLSLLVGILLLSYVPFFTLYLIMAFHPGSIPIPVFNFFGWIRYFNSCLNPFIYAYAVPAYRKAFVSIVFRGKWRP